MFKKFKKSQIVVNKTVLPKQNKIQKLFEKHLEKILYSMVYNHLIFVFLRFLDLLTPLSVLSVYQIQ